MAGNFGSPCAHVSLPHSTLFYSLYFRRVIRRELHGALWSDKSREVLFKNRPARNQHPSFVLLRDFTVAVDIGNGIF